MIGKKRGSKSWQSPGPLLLSAANTVARSIARLTASCFQAIWAECHSFGLKLCNSKQKGTCKRMELSQLLSFSPLHRRGRELQLDQERVEEESGEGTWTTLSEKATCDRIDIKLIEPLPCTQCYWMGSIRKYYPTYEYK
jgi:hypothetical protein